VHLVELRVADPGGELFDEHMGGTGITDLQIIDHQRSADVDVDGCFDLHEHLHANA
jgi:hypothetical protein